MLKKCMLDTLDVLYVELRFLEESFADCFHEPTINSEADIRMELDTFFITNKELIDSLSIDERKEFMQTIEELFDQTVYKDSYKSLLNKSIPFKEILGVLLGSTGIVETKKITRRAAILGGFLLAFTKAIPALAKTSKFEILNTNKIKFILYHVTDGVDGKYIEGVLNKNNPLGAHYLVTRDKPEVMPMVPEKYKAIHAGKSVWYDEKLGKLFHFLNGYAIGIECVDNKTGGLTDSQYILLKQKINEIQEKYNIPDERVLPHGLTTYRIHKGGWIRGRKTCGLKISRLKLGLSVIPEDKSSVECKRYYKKYGGNYKKTPSYKRIYPLQENSEINELVIRVNSEFQIASLDKKLR